MNDPTARILVAQHFSAAISNRPLKGRCFLVDAAWWARLTAYLGWSQSHSQSPTRGRGLLTLVAGVASEAPGVLDNSSLVWAALLIQVHDRQACRALR